MRNVVPALRYVLIAAIVLILVALLSWYIVLRNKQAATAKEDAGRGAGLPEQSFGGSAGSTYENIVSSLSSLVGGSGGEGESAPRLLQVSKTPTAGMGFVVSGTSTRLRFVERSTGYVLEASPEAGELTRLTSTLVPRVYEAIIANDRRVIMRSVEDDQITTLVGNITSSSTAGTSGMLTEVRLPDGIRSIAIDPAGKEIFYLIDSPSGTAGIRAAVDGTKQKQVFSSGISGWQPHFLSLDRIVLVQNASDGVEGYAYELKKDGQLSLLVKATPGLTILPRQSSPALLYGESGGGLALFARINNTSSTVSLPIKTTADKCVWAPASAKASSGTAGIQLIAFCAVPQVSPGRNFLDRWYRGETHPSDAWWRVDVSAASAELLYAPSVALDVEHPVIDESGTYIAFMNAADKSLWRLRISEQ